LFRAHHDIARGQVFLGCTVPKSHPPSKMGAAVPQIVERLEAYVAGVPRCAPAKTFELSRAYGRQIPAQTGISGPLAALTAPIDAAIKALKGPTSDDGDGASYC